MSDEHRAARRPLRAVADFFESAEELRSVFDERFQDPRALHPDRFVWDYWNVPDEFSYFRTYAERYFPSSVYGRFLQRLRLWGQEELGSSRFSPIWLSYYIEGCVQELHVDAFHGPWSFVYSLTRWETKKFTGGETLLLRPDGSSETIPARFNQLIAFDPRIPHAVTRVAGTREPREARLVLHGWFMEPALRCEGGLGLASCQRQLERAWPALEQSLGGLRESEGLVVVRANVDTSGVVENVEVMVDLLAMPDDSGHQAALTSIRQFIGGMTFEVTDATRITLPIRFPLTPLSGRRDSRSS